MSTKLQELNIKLDQRQKEVEDIRSQIQDIKLHIIEEVKEVLPTLGIFREFKWISIEQEGIIEDNSFMFMPNIYDNDKNSQLQRYMSELRGVLNLSNSFVFYIDDNIILKSCNQHVCIDVYYEKGLPNEFYYNRLKDFFNKYGIVLSNVTQLDYIKLAECNVSKAKKKLEQINKLIEFIEKK